MKKLIVAAMVSGFLSASTGLVFAGWFKDDSAATTTTTTTTTTTAAAAPVQQPVVTKSAPQKQAGNVHDAVANRKAELNGTEWAILTKPMSGKGKSEKDTLTFLDNKVISKNMSAGGYGATNFSMRLLEDNETYAWETMQVSEKGGTAFWRGDIGPDGVMRGVVSIRDKAERVTDFNFVSSGSTKVAVPAAAAK